MTFTSRTPHGEGFIRGVRRRDNGGGRRYSTPTRLAVITCTVLEKGSTFSRACWTGRDISWDKKSIYKSSLLLYRSDDLSGRDHGGQLWRSTSIITVLSHVSDGVEYINGDEPMVGLIVLRGLTYSMASQRLEKLRNT